MKTISPRIVGVLYSIMTKKLVIRESENTKAEGRGIFCFTNDDVSRLLSVLNAR